MQRSDACRASTWMGSVLQVALLALLLGLGNALGGVAAEFTRTTPARLSLALHFAAGIVFGVIALELAPRAFGGTEP